MAFHKMTLLILILIIDFILATNTKFLLTTSELPDDLREIPAVGNGHVATQVYHDTVYMNNVYNGKSKDSHRARIPSPVAITATVSGEWKEESYTLDMHRGVFIAKYSTEEIDLEQRVYAHRVRKNILVNEITVKEKREQQNNNNITLTLNWGEESPDLHKVEEELVDNSTRYNHWETKQSEFNETVRPVHMFWTDVPSWISVDEGENEQTWLFIASLSVDKEDAELEFLSAIEDGKTLFNDHAEAWEILWNEGRVEINGNETLAQIINSCFFHILISTPDEQHEHNTFAGLSPGGLARGGKINASLTGGPYNDYAGHVFWDMDTWIMPPVMILHPKLAPVMMSARTRVLDAVRKHAENTGNKGARFPWEQAHTGFETCPWEPASLYQIHITGDVAFSIRQYLYMSGDAEFANDTLNKELVMDIARFWEGRVTDGGVKGYEIYGVMGPDEYHYNVNNSVFTNYNGKLALTTPLLMAEMGASFTPSERDEMESFKKTSDKMFILFDEENQYHPQFEGFQRNATIKQSDVVLLGYPLMMDMSRETRENDLLIYEDLTDEFGPDTGTWSMHTVGWLELGDEDKAAQIFAYMFRNINGPFNIFSEKPAWSDDGMRATNFITGMGGMLQAVLFGYGGVRQRQHFMEVHPYLLPTTEGWAIRGLHYRDNQLDLEIDIDGLIVTLTYGATDKLFLYVDDEEEVEMAVGVNYEVKRARTLFVTESDKAFLPSPSSTPDSSATPGDEANSALYNLELLAASFMFVMKVI